MDKMKLALMKFELLKAMHLLVMSMNDEGAYLYWINTIPDQASDEDLLEIAMDEDESIYREACQDFRRICEDHLEHGFYLGGFGKPGGLYGAKKLVTEEEE